MLELYSGLIINEEMIYLLLMFIFFVIGCLVGFYIIPEKTVFEVKETKVISSVQCLDFPLVNTVVYYVKNGIIVEDMITKVNIEINDSDITYILYGKYKEEKAVKKFDNSDYSKLQVRINSKYGLSYECRGDGYYLYELCLRELPDNFFFNKEECIEYYNNKLLEEFKNRLI